MTFVGEIGVLFFEPGCVGEVVLVDVAGDELVSLGFGIEEADHFVWRYFFLEDYVRDWIVREP